MFEVLETPGEEKILPGGCKMSVLQVSKSSLRNPKSRWIFNYSISNPLAEYFEHRNEIEKCPIYDVLVDHPFYLVRDTKDSFSDSAVIRGLNQAPGLVSTAIPDQVQVIQKLNLKTNATLSTYSRTSKHSS